MNGRDLDAAIAAVGSATGRRYWRALDELMERPDFRERLQREFPALAGGAPEWRRRDLLKCLGGALALAGLDGCGRAPDAEALPYVVQPDGAVPGIARRYASAIEMDGVAQPIIGETRDGRPIKLDGNPDHPACSGGSTALVQAELLGLYDPDRSGAPRYLGQVSDWARFDRAVAALRQRLGDSGGAGFRLLTGPVRSPTLLGQIERLLDRWPDARWHAWSPLADHREEALRDWLGRPVDRRLSLDAAHAVVAFDDDLLGTGPDQLWLANGWGTRRRAYP